MKINLIIGGAEKGGTTALHHLLKSHPKILMPRAKELHFFSNENHFMKGGVDYRQYHRMFIGRSYKDKFKLYYKYLNGGRIFGDASPEYMYWKPVPERIYQYNPSAKWILLLRNPIDRAFSHYKMNVFRKKYEKLSFMDALHKNQELLLQDKQDKVFSYIDKGFYSGQLKNIYKYFDKSNVFIETSDIFKDKTFYTLNNICNFLGIDSYQEQCIPPSYDNNVGVDNIVMSDQEREYLVNIFRDEIHKLEIILNRDLSSWME